MLAVTPIVTDALGFLNFAQFRTALRGPLGPSMTRLRPRKSVSRRPSKRLNGPKCSAEMPCSFCYHDRVTFT
jgi:hypothetical protein